MQNLNNGELSGNQNSEHFSGKLVSFCGLRPPDSPTGLCPGTPLGDIRPQTPSDLLPHRDKFLATPLNSAVRYINLKTVNNSKKHGLSIVTEIGDSERRSNADTPSEVRYFCSKRVSHLFLSYSNVGRE